MGLCLLHALPLRSLLSSKTCAGRSERDRLLLAEPLRVLWEEHCGLCGEGECSSGQPQVMEGIPQSSTPHSANPNSFSIPPSRESASQESWRMNQIEIEHMKELLQKSPLENRGHPRGQAEDMWFVACACLGVTSRYSLRALLLTPLAGAIGTAAPRVSCSKVSLSTSP